MSEVSVCAYCVCVCVLCTAQAPSSLANEGQSGTLKQSPMAKWAIGLMARTQHSRNSSNGAPGTEQQPACQCLLAGAGQLLSRCSRSTVNSTEKGHELVAACMEYLANNSSHYLKSSAGTLPAEECKKQLLVHVFWAGGMTWKLNMVIQSFLITHFRADEGCGPKPTLYVWLQGVQPSR